MSDKFNINSIENLNNNTVNNYIQKMADTPEDTIKDAKNEMIIKAELLGLTLEEYKIFKRLITLEKLKHSNNSSVVQMAKKLCDLTAEKLKLVQPDWLLKWIDYSSCVSDETVQQLWAKILSGEVNNPGTFSLQILNTLSMIDYKTAKTLEKLYDYSLIYNNEPYICYPSSDRDLKPKDTLSENDLLNLDSIGIIKLHYAFGSSYILFDEFKKYDFYYNDKKISITPKNQNDTQFIIVLGRISLTLIGKELFSLNKQKYDNNIFLNIISKLEKDKYELDY
ncbi:MAG: DUF2806 domain-containing protein [Sphaerochaetaceae bacterium]|nr:DUF2806 domain-containing protein [Sphaerochaetaceae bacterium]MDC7242565.1 DUF2806 domain-containing protein [Sphaerochaetaceae bacterium]